MDSAEFAEWVAEYSIESWGEVRNDVMIAQLCLMTYMIHAKKGAKRLKIADFMPYAAGKTETLTAKTPQQMEALLKKFAETYGQHRNPNR